MTRVTVLCVVSLVSIMGPTMAQQAPNSSKPAVNATTGLSGAPTDPNLTVAAVKMQDGIRISKLIGSAVYNDQNEKIGTLDDLLMKDGNTIVMAVVSVGGFLGIGNKLVAVAGITQQFFGRRGPLVQRIEMARQTVPRSFRVSLLVLIDERAGVAAARARGLEVTGTLWSAGTGLATRLTDLSAAFAALQATNFHVRQELLDALLARDRVWRGGA